MKRILLLALFLLSLNQGFSQDKEVIKTKSESKIEAFSSETGSLIEKSNTEVGKLGSVTIKASTITNLLSNNKTKGLRIEKTNTSKYGGDYINFLDEDEIEAVIKSIDILKEKVTTTPSTYVEIIFRSRSGFEFGAYYSSEWKYFIQIDRYKSDSMYFIGSKDVQDFETLIKQGKEILKK